MDFLKILLISLIFCFTFFFFGGWMLFDFSRHVYLPIAACAFVIAVAAYLFYAQSRRISQLEDRIRQLEEKHKP